MAIPECTCGLHGKPRGLTNETIQKMNRCDLSRSRRPPLPYQPQKPYIHPAPEKAKAVTIGVAFVLLPAKTGHLI